MIGSDKSAVTHGGPNTNASRPNRLNINGSATYTNIVKKIDFALFLFETFGYKARLS
jgi:hypothetical protein